MNMNQEMGLVLGVALGELEDVDIRVSKNARENS